MKNYCYVILLAAFLLCGFASSCTSHSAVAKQNELCDSLDILKLYPAEKVVPLLKNYKWHGHVIGNENSPEPLTLLYFSDVHGDKRRLGRIMKFYNFYEQYFDGIIHTGDAVLARYEEDWSWWEECGASKVMNLCGNHDTWTGDSEASKGAKAWKTGYSAKVGFERYIKPYMEEWGVSGYLDNSMCWYKDYEPQQIRIIAVDNFHFKEQVELADGTFSDTYPYDGWKVDSGEQQNWFESVLSDAREKHLSVICASHVPAIIDPIESSFMSLFPLQATGMQKEFIEAVQNFIDKGGDFITWIQGHNHQDWFGTIKGYPQQLTITIDTARDYREDGTTWSNNTKPDNTIAMDCFNILNVDPYRKCISLHRIGSEYDKYGRHIEGLVYNYKDRQLLWN